MLFMKLKTQTDYALRVLLHLAFSGEMASVDALATAHRISREHLFKIVQQLARLGYVQTQTGRKGGVRLAREARSIFVGEVIAAFEGRDGVLACVNDPDACVLEPGCVLRLLLIRAESAFYDTVARVSIANLIPPQLPDGGRTGGVYNLNIRRASTDPKTPTPPAPPEAGGDHN